MRGLQVLWASAATPQAVVPDVSLTETCPAGAPFCLCHLYYCLLVWKTLLWTCPRTAGPLVACVYAQHRVLQTARATLAAGAEADESQDWVYVFQFSLPLGRAALAATRSNVTLVDYLLSHQPRKPNGERMRPVPAPLRPCPRTRCQNARRSAGSSAGRSNRTEPRADIVGQLAADVRPRVVYAAVVGERDLNQTNVHNLPQPDPNTVRCAWEDPNTVRCAWGLRSRVQRVCHASRALPQ